MAKERGLVISNKSLAECMSRSIVFGKAIEMPNDSAPEHDQTSSIVDRMGTNTNTNVKFNNSDEISKESVNEKQSFKLPDKNVFYPKTFDAPRRSQDDAIRKPPFLSNVAQPNFVSKSFQAFQKHHKNSK